MAQTASIEFPIPAGIRGFKLPRGVQGRLEALLDKQDGGKTLSAAERREAEGLDRNRKLNRAVVLLEPLKH